MLNAICHTPQAGWSEVSDLSTIASLCERRGARVWAEADVSVLDDRDMDTIAASFGLHELAVEDAAEARERPKLESYEGHLFMVVHELNLVGEQLEPVQIACFVGARWVLVLHAGASRALEETRRRLLALSGDLQGGSAVLMHALLDTIVDDYERIADGLENVVEDLEERLLADPRASAQKEIYTLKQRLARMRRYALPVSRLLADVVEGNAVGDIPSESGAFFRDVHDHTLRIAEQERNVEDLADALLELVGMEQAKAQNEVTKRLTGWAAIIAVPTLISGIYGMNFGLVPQEGRIFGFWFALGLMVSAAIALFVFFKRRGWI